MASQMEYPDDDLDAMLDDELEIMREMEKENEAEIQSVPARKSLEFGASVSLGGVKSFETNIVLQSI